MRILTILLFLTTPAVAFAQAAGGGDSHWKAQSWQDAVATVPCAAFVRKPDGSYTMPGTIDLPGQSVISNVTFGPDSDSKQLDARCKSGQ